MECHPLGVSIYPHGNRTPSLNNLIEGCRTNPAHAEDDDPGITAVEYGGLLDRGLALEGTESVRPKIVELSTT